MTTRPEGFDAPHLDGEGSLADRVQDFIRNRITSGELVPGDRIKEREVAVETGISRIPIREALRGLATEGFVTLSPNRGAVVTQLEPRDLDEIFEVREALEGQMCVLAARKASRPELDSMIAAVEEADSALQAGDLGRVGMANLRFHDILIAMAHNEVLVRLLEPLQNRLHWLLRQNEDPTELCVEHRALAEAIMAGDQDRAEALAKAHVHTSKRVAMRQLFGPEVPRGRG